MSARPPDPVETARNVSFLTGMAHAFDREQQHARATRLRDCAAALTLLPHLLKVAEAVERIAEMPTSERNPDGDEQAAYSMRLVAQEALAVFYEAAEKELGQ